MDKGNVVCSAFIDLRKAFDSLDYCLLLQRISKLGVHCEVRIVEWFKELKQQVFFHHGDL